MRLIDADAAIAECNKDGAYGYISAAELMELPTIELVRCRDCIYYDAPHVEKDGERYEYADMPADAFDKFGIGVHSGYGVNVGGRCLRSKAKLARGKSIFMDEDDYCSKGERRADDDR